MSGTAVERGADGRWFVRPYLGTDRLTGRPIRPYRSWPADMSREGAQAEADAWLATVAPSAVEGASKRLDSMLAAYVADPQRDFAPSTRAAYMAAVRLHIAPTIGAIPYDELQPYEVAAAYRILLTDTAARPAISRATLRRDHALLSGAYRHWSRRIGRNPMLEVDAPVPERVEPVALDEWGQDALTAALLDVMAEDGADRANVVRRTTAFAGYIALMQGLRCGEACALRRRDWREGAHDVRVCGTVVEKPRLHRQGYPKRGSAGNVAAAPEVEEAIRSHIAWQGSWMRSGGPDAALLSDRADGRVPRPSTVTARFTALARELGMPEGTTMHTLRHTHATWLLMNGYDMRTIQERLRHRDVATTLRIYSSVLPGRDAQAAAAFAGAHKGRKS